MSKISLKTLLVPNKAAEVEFPGYEGFKINLSFLSREALVAIRKKSTKTVFKNRQAVEEGDDELFLKLYVDASIKGWSGFKLEYLNKLAPIELEPGSDLTVEIDYSPEDALALMKASAEFDSFISQTVTELSAFSQTNGNK